MVNPFSDSGRTGKFINQSESLIRSKLQDVDFYYISEDESLPEIAHSKSAEYEVVIACGGDGTASNVAKGLLNTDAILGVLPTGSGNDFAKMLGMVHSFKKNLDSLKRLEIKLVDAVKVNDSTFINTMGLGFDGLTSALAAQSLFTRGNIRYIVAGLKAIFIAKPFYITANIKNGTAITTQTWVAIIANGKWEGGKYLVSPLSNHSDGELELLISKKISLLRLSFEFLKLSIGFKISESVFETHHLKECAIDTSEPVFVHMDGEVYPKENRFSIQIIPSSLKVITGTL